MTSAGEARSRTWLLALAVGAIAAVVFLPTLRGEWLYDDHPLIEENLRIHSFAAWTHWFTSDFWDVGMEATGRILYWRPLVSASYAIDWRLGGGDPFAFHLTNLVTYGIVCALAFTTLRRWIGTTWPAFLVALLFALHPTKAESVAWISGRTDILCALGLLVASAGMGRRMQGRLRSGLALEVLGTLFAYGCKEQAIVLPLFAGVEAWVATGRPPLDRKVLRRIAVAMLPQIAVAIAYVVIRTIVLPIEASSGGIQLGVADHAIAVAETFGRYLALAFAPHELSSQQGLMLAKNHALVHSIPYAVLGVIGILLLCAVAFYARRRWPVATIGTMFFLGALVPTSNLKLTSLATLVAERFLFIPILGVAFVVGVLLERLPLRRAAPLVGALALALGTITLSHGTDFVSEREFWAHELELHPQSSSALRYTLTTALGEKRYQDALDTLHQVAAMHTTYDWLRNEAVQFTFDVALVMSALSPDRDVTALRSVDAFCRDIIEHRKTTANLDVRGMHVSIPMPSLDGDSSIFVAQLQALRAEIHSRLGEDDEALRIAAAARATCHDCVSFVTLDALTRARVGRYSEALALLDDLSHISLDPRIVITRQKVMAAQASGRTGESLADAFARGDELATLGLWGRAYAAVSPFRDRLDDDHAVRFAELAFRAGDAQTARTVLARTSVDVDATEASWALDMGWVEAGHKRETPPRGRRSD